MQEAIDYMHADEDRARKNVAAFTGMDIVALTEGVAADVPREEDGSRDLRKQNSLRAIKALAKGIDAPLIIENGFVVFGDFTD